MSFQLLAANLKVSGTRKPQVVGRKYAAVFGFETAADADRATNLIKKASVRKSGR